MSRLPQDRLRAFAAHLEEETPTTSAEHLAGQAIARAEQRVIGRLRAFSARLEAGTRAGLAELIAVRALTAGSQRSTGYALRRIGALTAAAVTLSVAAVGVGAIANQASPGDLLYGVDRAYEAAGHVLGAKTPHTEERLTEALTLIDRGRGADAVALIDEAVKDYSAQHGLTDLEKSYAAARLAQSVVTTTTSPSTPAATAVSPPTTPVAASEEPDPVSALRLAVEMLLRNVKAAGTESTLAAVVTDSALQAAAAASAIEGPTAAAAGTTPTTSEAVTTTTTSVNAITLPVDTPTTAPGDTTTTSSDGTTTLTMPDGTTTTLPGEATTTTVPGGSSTTTTTAPDGTSTTTTTAPDDGSGGIILPPQP